ncbi:MAG: hypothetical protein OEV55_08865 [candidate division Zixibacteria bacterium]|nr:hypothetical protein [candidate division Zixibacteria bacterium]
MRGSKTIIILGGMIIVLMILTFSACKKSTQPTTNLDKDAIMRLVAEDSTTFPREITQSDSIDFPKIAVVDSVKFWRRKITDINRNIQVDIHSADSNHLNAYAFVTITDNITGFLYIRGWQDTAFVFITKPFSDQAVKSAYFEKIGENEDPYRGWSLEGISGVLSHSLPTSTRIIEQAHIVSSSGYDKTLFENDITEIVLIDSLMTLQVGDTITLTVTTGDSTDLVYLHRPVNYWRPQRRPFINNGDGTFSVTWTINEISCDCNRHHFAIDVIKRATLYGDDAYDSRIWGLIYRATQP